MEPEALPRRAPARPRLRAALAAGAALLALLALGAALSPQGRAAARRAPNLARGRRAAPPPPPPRVPLRGDELLLIHGLVDCARKLLFCYVPKAGCSGWKLVFKALKGLPPGAPHADYFDRAALAAAAANATGACRPSAARLDYLGDLGAARAAEVLADPAWTKVAFVRDPATRAVSGFNDKFANADLAAAPGGNAHLRDWWEGLLGGEAPAAAAAGGAPPALPQLAPADFAAGLARLAARSDRSVRGAYADAHFLSQTQICQFDRVEYDFIGRLESLEADVAAARARVPGLAGVAFPSREAQRFPSSATLPAHVRGEELFAEGRGAAVADAYADDFRLLGYERSAAALRAGTWATPARPAAAAGAAAGGAGGGLSAPAPPPRG